MSELEPARTKLERKTPMKRSHIALALVVALLVAFTYSVRAQSGSLPPRTRNIRSFYRQLNPGHLADVFTVPADRVFLITDVVVAGANGLVQILEGGGSGEVRAVFNAASAEPQVGFGFDSGPFTLRSGIPFGPDTTLTLQTDGLGPLRVTIAGFLIEP